MGSEAASGCRVGVVIFFKRDGTGPLRRRGSQVRSGRMPVVENFRKKNRILGMRLDICLCKLISRIVLFSGMRE